MKNIRLTAHAKEQCAERGARETEVREAIQHGVREPAKSGRVIYRLNLPYHAFWQGKFYAIKQVAPVVAEAENEIVVVTVYTFYF
jgi:hypothetical protein